jgi:hypothetical protein
VKYHQANFLRDSQSLTLRFTEFSVFETITLNMDFLNAPKLVSYPGYLCILHAEFRLFLNWIHENLQKDLNTSETKSTGVKVCVPKTERA